MELEEVKSQIKLKSFQYETEDGLLKESTVKLSDVLKILDGLLILPVVVGSIDNIVIEVSDNELLIVTVEELIKMQESAMEFDGFESWIVRGRLV